eukprot:TRINITY_DN14324_c0_g1_i1.p1 TRINITY_DN14324_c0_g1~~TRINITY_DN14324_c0_g1_i1.p1  ORF type:complete len:280 (+),score=57.99 TRINITY_DN14324_c0_g1_i1:244-1083(+)
MSENHLNKFVMFNDNDFNGNVVNEDRSGNEVSDFYGTLFNEENKNIDKNNCFIEDTSNRNNNVDDDIVEEKLYCGICEQVIITDKDIHLKSLVHLFNKNKKGPDLLKNYHINSKNRGYQLLLKQGWKEKGLGKEENSIIYPIKTIYKNDKKGIGIKTNNEPRVTHKQETIKSLKIEMKKKRKRNRYDLKIIETEAILNDINYLSNLKKFENQDNDTSNNQQNHSSELFFNVLNKIPTVSKNQEHNPTIKVFNYRSKKERDQLQKLDQLKTKLIQQELFY